MLYLDVLQLVPAFRSFENDHFNALKYCALGKIYEHVGLSGHNS